MKQAEIADRLLKIEASMTRMEMTIGALVSPADVRTHIASNMTTADQVDVLAQAAPIQEERIDAIVTWLSQRMSGEELRFQFEDLLFVTKQLSSIYEGQRSDLLQMRSEVRRLAALLEQTLRARVEDERAWQAGDAERRRGVG